MEPRTNYPRLAAEIGKRIRAARTEAGMRQTDLRDKIGKSYSYISHLEGGALVPSLPALYQIAAGLGVDVSELLPKRPNKSGTW